MQSQPLRAWKLGLTTSHRVPSPKSQPVGGSLIFQKFGCLACASGLLQLEELIISSLDKMPSLLSSSPIAAKQHFAL